MFSGGLDSILATKIMHDEGFDVTVLHFYNGFNGKLGREIQNDPDWKWTPSEAVANAAEKLGVTLVGIDVKDEFIDLINKPKHNYGTAINPCIDCRIFLLNKAYEYMEKEDAILIFTGEVMGQRPMSQHKQAMQTVAKKSGFEGRLLRPLSAKLLEPTIPETEGIVNRDHLYGFSGRSRKPQQKLAKKYGIDYYPQPGGGCILTEKSFARRYHDLVNHSPNSGLSLEELNSLKVGRHLRLKSGIKVIVGRDETENNHLAKLLEGKCWVFDVTDIPCAMVFAYGDPSDEDLETVASFTGRYSKGLNEDLLTVTASKGDVTKEFTVKPAAPGDIEPFLIK
jgi:tRNA-uridine 2-sulfurtransferase